MSWAAVRLSGLLYVVGAAIPTQLNSIAARSSLPLVVIPLGLLACWHLGSRHSGQWRPIATAAAGLVISTTTMLAAGSMWWSLRHEHVTPLLAGPAGCVEIGPLPGVSGTPLEHWSTAALSVVEQGRAPQRVLLGDGACTVGPAAALPRTGNWFDLSRIS